MKKVVVLLRDDANEAMRVAAGLTIFGHEVACVVVNPDIAIAADNNNLELLELSEVPIVALQTDTIHKGPEQKTEKKDDQQGDLISNQSEAARFEKLNQSEFKGAIREADAVISL